MNLGPPVALAGILLPLAGIGLTLLAAIRATGPRRWLALALYYPLLAVAWLIRARSRVDLD